MSAPIETLITLDKTLLERVEALAQELNISLNQVVELAVTAYIEQKQIHTSPSTRTINQGDVFWLLNTTSSESIPHPQVVIQADVINHSRVQTVVVCALTSNIRRTNIPGNILLDVGEANLTKQSIVEVAKISTVSKAELGAYIGSLNEKRINQILSALRFLQTSFYDR